MKQYLKFRSVYGESFSEIERITHTLENGRSNFPLSLEIGNCQRFNKGRVFNFRKPRYHGNVAPRHYGLPLIVKYGDGGYSVRFPVCRLCI